MLKAITGLMGAGKGVFNVIKMTEELQDTDRHIITNFAFRLHPWVRRLSRKRSKAEKGYLAYLMDEFGQTFDAEKRIHVLDDSELLHFYLWRINDEGLLVKIPEIRDDKGNIIAFAEDAFGNTQPVCYDIDEAGQFWNARGWQKTADALGFYIRQHRKAGDDVWLSVQNESDLDKQLRLKIQEYNSCVNHKMRKMGIFKQPDVISVITTSEPPSMRGKSVMVPKIIRFNKDGIGGSYDTAQGAGVKGRGADIEHKAKGLPWWMLFAGLVLLGVVIVFLAKGGGWFTGKVLTNGFHKTAPGKAVEKGLAQMGVPFGQSKSNSIVELLPRGNNLTDTNIVYMTAYTMARVGSVTKVRVFLSDGSDYDESDGVELIERRGKYVIIKGKKYEMAKVKNNEFRGDVVYGSAGSGGVWSEPVEEGDGESSLYIIGSDSRAGSLDANNHKSGIGNAFNGSKLRPQKVVGHSNVQQY